MALDELKEYLYGCTHCGTCKDVLDIFLPACPAGEKYQLESYFASGKMLIARGVASGAVPGGSLTPAYMVMVDGLKKEDNVFGKPKAGRGDWAKDTDVKDAARE